MPSAPPKTLDIVAAVIAGLKRTCTRQPGGGYKANEVGHALYTLGFDARDTRTQFLKAIPGLHEQGSGADRVLVF